MKRQNISFASERGCSGRVFSGRVVPLLALVALTWGGGVVVPSRADDHVLIADFEAGLSGFVDAIVRDTEVAYEGRASGRIDGRFSGEQQWVTASLPLDLSNELTGLHFWVRSPHADRFSLRLTDSTGQCHQQRPAVPADDQWHRLDITSFTSGPGYQKWGGANDGVFHWPARQLDIIYEKGYLRAGGDTGQMWIDQVTVDTVGAPRSIMADFPTQTLADFEGDMSGFKGAIQRDEKIAHGGKASGRIEADFPRAGEWVTATLAPLPDRELKQIRFWVRSTTANGLAFRAVDRTGQNHQQRLIFEPNGEWQMVKINNLIGGRYYQRWGGANDGKFHWPAQSLSLILERGNVVAGVQGKTQVWVDDMEASVSQGRALPDLELGEPVALGNVFVNGQPARLPIVSRGDRVTWTVEDFYHRRVAEGVTPIRDGQAVIEPPIAYSGYFDVTMAAMLGDEVVGRAQTTLAIIPDNSGMLSADSPFGVMTHFAQGWDVDIMPLIVRAGIASIRDELYWDQVEKKPGEYVFHKQFETYMARAKELGLCPLIVMSFDNKLYDQGLTPYTDAGRAGYANYGKAILDHYGDQIRWLEIWNEYNGTWCKGPAAEDRPKFYAEMLKAAYTTIKATRPEVKVLGGGAVLIPLPYFEGIFKHDGLKYMDGVVIHPYRGQPEGVEDEIRDLKALMAKYGEVKPIWVTETGQWDKEPDGRRRNASYLVRMYTLLLSEKVEKIYWYLMRDYQDFTTMGLVHDPKSPLGRYAAAPLYAAYANLIHQLYGARYVAREATDERTRIYRFDAKDGTPIRVCWATAPAHVALRAEQPLTAIDLTGRPHELQPTQGEAYLTLNDTPLYVRGPVTSIGAADRFAIQPQQQVDIRQEAQVRFTVNGDAIRGQFRIDDRRLDIPGPGTYSLKLPEQPTDREGEQTYQYQLTLDGRLVGMGAVQLRVTDPLAFEASSAMISEGALHLVLRNESKETAYELQSVAWRIGEESQQQARVVTMPAAHELRMALPVAELRPYATAPARATVQLAGRSPVVFAGRVSYDPLPRHTATIDGDLSDWREAPAIDIARDMPVVFGQGACSGEARLAWDEKALQFAVNVGGRPTDADDFCFAVADASGEGAWYEFRAAMVNGKPQVVCAIAPDAARIGAVGAAQVKIQRTDEATVYELALPWSAIAPLTSAVPAVRVGMLIHSAGRAAQWGEGMYPGHDPRGLRLCQRISPKESVAQGAFNVEIRPLPTAAITPGPGRVIAHFADDYSNVQGRRNWYYGYYDGQGNGQGDGRPPRGAYTDDDFKPMTYTETVWGYEWGGPMRYLKISRDSMHPQASDGRPVWAVRRWKSDVQGTIRLSGKIAQVGEKKGDGVGLVALVDGRVVARWMIGGPDHPPSIPYQAETKVNVGSLVDLAVTPGPGINPDYDATSMTEQIELLP